MPSSFTTNLTLEKQATGENKATWGQKANTVFDLIDEAISGKLDVTVADVGETILTSENGISNQSRPMMLKLVGTLTANRTIVFPSGRSKIYIVNNATSGGFAVTLKIGSSTYLLKNGQQKLAYTDGITLWTNDALITLSAADGRWNIPATIDGSGRMEVGRSIDFHNANSDSSDFAVRLDTGNTITDLYIQPSTVGAVGAKIWTAANDGSGSGMDADLVDGLHANEIFPQAPNDGKVYGRVTVAGVGGWVETPGPYVGFVAGDMSLGGKNAAGLTLPPRIAFNNDRTLTGVEVASVSETGEIRGTGSFLSTTTQAILATIAGGTVYLRPNGWTDTTQETTINSSGDMNVNGSVTAVQDFKSSSLNTIIATNGAANGGIYLRPRGTASGVCQGLQAYDGGFRTAFVHVQQDGNTGATHSFYNGSGPLGSGSWGAYLNGSGTGNTGALFTNPYPSASSGSTYFSFHQPNVALWSVFANGPVIGSSGWQVSDAKIKSEIKDCNCNEAHHKLKSIKVKSYRKDDGVVSRSSVGYDEMGFIAQELEAILPEAVMDVPVPRHDAKGFALEPTETIKVTNDRTLLATLWAAVQHQAGMIEKLQAEMKALKGAA